ncbi:MAG: branched-chain amino acid aminotransferase [Pseudolabrys sp.]
MSRTLTYHDGRWHEGDVHLMGPRTHGVWLGSTVFDGARAFEGVTPDLDLHCARINRSAAAIGLEPKVTASDWLALSLEGVKKLGAGSELYIRPMYWACDGAAGGGVRFDPASTDWCLCIYDAPMPTGMGFSLTLSPFRRPTLECMPTDAKASCLYPNNSRALLDAYKRNFDNCVMLDMLGNVAELANANVMVVKDGVVQTPAPNGTFLNGITRQRVIGLLRQSGTEVFETTLTWDDVKSADEIFSVGNFTKVAPAIRIEERELVPGPIYKRARALYWEFAHTSAGTAAAA